MNERSSIAPQISTSMPGNVCVSIGTSGIDPPEPTSIASRPYARASASIAARLAGDDVSTR
jgi:hypothetical protein